MRDISGYINAISIEPNIGLNEYFIESTYKDSIGRTLPCYLLTRKGCEMVANKMTGPKGVIFTAKYIDRFHEYEDRLKAQELQVNQKALLLLKVYDGGLQAVEAAKAIVETETAPLKFELEAAKPKVSYYDSILSAPNAVSVTTIAKDYGMSAKALNEFLHQLGIQYKRGAAWMFRPFAP